MGSKEKNFISAVIYVHNAEKSIGVFLETVIKVLEDNFECSEVICVNDVSGDESISIIGRVVQRAKKTNISIINLSYFHGVELAMNAGVDMAIGDYVFEFDNTNLDFNPSVIMEVYNRALEGYDIVRASADRKEKFTSMLFYTVFNKFADYPNKMSTESFRLLSRRVINRIGSMNKTVPYRKAVYANCGLKAETIKYRTIGKDNKALDKTEKGYRLNLAVDSLILFTEFGYRFSMVMTILMMLTSVFMLVYSLIMYFTSNPVEGWTTTILFLSVVFFGLFGILTIIVKYLQLVIDMIFKRKHYSYESIEKLT